MKETQYKVFFISNDNERISNENIYVADRKDAETAKRYSGCASPSRISNTTNRASIILWRMTIKGMEILRHEIIMDIAFADDFGFNL